MLPPYAKAIVNSRFDGRHPAMILMCVGAQWVKINDHRYPFVFVPEADYLRGCYDFWFCAGVPVTLYAESTETATWLQLAGDLADVTAPVGIQSTYFEGHEVDYVMREIRAARYLDDAWWLERDPVSGWPPWWSDARDLRYSSMRERWAAERRALGVAV
jgi:hypothetical protein